MTGQGRPGEADCSLVAFNMQAVWDTDNLLACIQTDWTAGLKQQLGEELAFDIKGY